MEPDTVSDVLDEVLRQAQDLGFFGPSPMGEQRRHAERFCRLAVAGLPTGADEAGWAFLDLGSGGGLPGLVLAAEIAAWPGACGTLLDSQARRTAFLDEAVERMGLAGRITVVTARAEDAARDPAHRGRYDLVVSRAFGAPAVTAECAVGFLRSGGRLVVSEPPEPDPQRWDLDGVATLGFAGPELVSEGETHAARLHLTAPPAERWPRKRGIPQKRPLW